MRVTTRLQEIAIRIQPRLLSFAGRLEANPIVSGLKQAFSELNLLLLGLSAILMLRTFNQWWGHFSGLATVSTQAATTILSVMSLLFVVLLTQALMNSRPDGGAITVVNVAAYAIVNARLQQVGSGNPFILACVMTAVTVGLWALLTWGQKKLAPIDSQLAALRHFLAVCVVAGYLLGLAWMMQRIPVIGMQTALGWLTMDHPFWVFVLVFVEMGLWYIGINGYGVLAPVVFLFAYRNLTVDLGAIASNRAPQAILTPNFWDYFLSFSGAGLVGALVILCLVNPNPDLKRLGRSSFSSILFSVSEPILYGLPITMNPYLLVPFLFGTPLLGVAQWFVFKLGWVALPAFHVADLPLPFSVLLSTLDWRSLVLAAVTIAVATAMYAPGLIRWSKVRPADTSDDDFTDLDVDF
ncbi:PTS transporter subunit EIIC [Lacticaseibacillus nasuensis]|nr:PTS transporter subunit EIIC [Lacticaseibacillus nasuensis]